MKKIAISGYYGMYNYGDDLFAVATSIAANVYWKNVEPVIIAPCQKKAGLKYGVPNQLGNIYPAHGFAGALCRSAFSVINAIGCQHYIFAGGSIFHSSKIDVKTVLSRLFKNRDNYFSALGVSVGPFATIQDEKAVKTLLHRFAYISVRDQRSYEAVKNLNIDVPTVLSADIAGIVPFIMPKLQKNDKLKSKRLIIGFSPCNIIEDQLASVNFCDVFVENIKKRDLDYIHVKIICLNEHPDVGDVRLCSYIANILSGLNISFELIFYIKIGVLDTWKEIANLDLYFTGRLHGALTAYMSGTPFFLLEYHQKCADFLAYIKKHDSERIAVLDLNQVTLKKVMDQLEKRQFFLEMPPCDYGKLSEKGFLLAPFSNN